jgi:hypothetical protein
MDNNKDNFELAVLEKLSTRQLAARFNCSQTNVRYWLKKYGLKTFVEAKLSKEELKHRIDVKRLTVKEESLAYKGGKCEKCGYDRCVAALEFHHRNPEEKLFSISRLGHKRSKEVLQQELDKCDLLCANCHREVHHNE